LIVLLDGGYFAALYFPVLRGEGDDEAAEVFENVVTLEDVDAEEGTEAWVPRDVVLVAVEVDDVVLDAEVDEDTEDGRTVGG